MRFICINNQPIRKIIFPNAVNKQMQKKKTQTHCFDILTLEFLPHIL